MRKDKVSIFVPTRSGSERVKNKNTKVFAGVKGGILSIKLKQLLDIQGIEDIILSTNDEESILVAERFGDSKIKIIRRPDFLCKSNTKVSELINYVANLIENKHIFWIHATAPFVETQDYEKALDLYLKNYKYDDTYSLASVSKIQQFLWDNEEKRMINHEVENGNWPRTQDLKPIYEINHAFYINSKENYIKYNNRVSPNMDIFELNRIKQIDIDWEDDFLLAEQIYKYLVLNSK